jgi:hypothetical protein
MVTCPDRQALPTSSRMSKTNVCPTAPPRPCHLHEAFLKILPRVETHGRVYFRDLRCHHDKEEAVAEMVALAWRWFVRLAGRGKDASRFPRALATFAARAVNAGRRLNGQEAAKDVLSWQARRRHGFGVEALPDFDTPGDESLAGALRDNTRTPPPEQAAFRLDFPAWLGTRTRRDRNVIEELMRGGRTAEVSEAFGISPSRVSQMRKEFRADWARFCGEEAAAPARPGCRVA